MRRVGKLIWASELIRGHWRYILLQSVCILTESYKSRNKMFIFSLCVCSVTQSCLTLCNSLDSSLPDFSVHGIFQAKNTGIGCHFLLQGIFPTQGSNPHLLYLLHWQVDSLPLSQLAISCSRVKAPTNLVFAQKLGQPLFSVKKGPVTTPHQGMELFLLDTYDNRL